MLTWETIIDTTPESNTTAAHLAEEPDSNLWEYYIANDRATDRSALISMGDYSNPEWSKTAKHLTSQEVKRIGIKHFPQIGAIGFFTLLHEERSKILAPIHTKLKKYTAPIFLIEETDNTFIFHCASPKDTTYICYRIVLRLGDFAIEYITYEDTLEVPKPVTTGTYDIYCIGYIHEGEAVSEDSLHYYKDVEGIRSDWPGPMEGSDIFVTDIEVTEDNKIHFTRSDGYKKDSDNVIPTITAAHFLEDGRLSLLLNTGTTIETDNSVPVGSSTLEALTDVTLDNPQNGESLVYKDAQWTNQLVQGGGGGGGDVDELLNKAAYLASEEEVTELPTAAEASYHVYSTEEQVVGIWIDGKPIYEKTVLYEGVIITNTTVFTDDTIDEIIDVKNQRFYDTNFASWNGILVTYGLILSYRGNAVNGDIHTAYGNRITKARFTVQYTKLADEVNTI